MDTFGDFLGPLHTTLLMAASHDNFRLVFWLTIGSAFVSVYLVVYCVQKTELSR
jgi:hypothetical protein